MRASVSLIITNDDGEIESVVACDYNEFVAKLKRRYPDEHCRSSSPTTSTANG